MGIEINLISFIPILINNNRKMRTERIIKYFIIQSLGSANFIFISIFLISFNKWFILNSQINNIIYLIINSSLFLKIGAAPFHFWFPKTIKGISWINCLILRTWQKIIPIIIISYCNINNFNSIFIISRALIGRLMGLNQTSLKLIISYSSINHISWIISAIIININLWINYFILYSLITIILIRRFNLININQINQFFSIKTLSLKLNFFIFLSLLRLGGLPPFLGFLPKWIVITQIIFYNNIFLLTIIIFTSLINLFFYTRIFYSFIIINFFEIKFIFNLNISKFNLLLNINFLSIFGLVFTFSIYL